MVKQIRTDLVSSKTSDPDCMPMMILKNFEAKLSYMLADLFNINWKASCFPDCRQVSPVVTVFKNVGERSVSKTYHTANLLSVVTKIYEKHVNSLINHFGK